MSARIFNRLSKIYYSPQRYWKGFAAIKKLAQAAKVSEDVARNWLMKQALWQVYLPAPRCIPRPKFDVPVPNKVHQADLLYLPHDRPPRSRKTFKYAFTVVDVAFRCYQCSGASPPFLSTNFLLHHICLSKVSLLSFYKIGE